MSAETVVIDLVVAALLVLVIVSMRALRRLAVDVVGLQREQVQATREASSATRRLVEEIQLLVRQEILDHEARLHGPNAAPSRALARLEETRPLPGAIAGDGG